MWHVAGNPQNRVPERHGLEGNIEKIGDQDRKAVSRLVRSYPSLDLELVSSQFRAASVEVKRTLPFALESNYRSFDTFHVSCG
jgi:hypothetical protein